MHKIRTGNMESCKPALIVQLLNYQGGGEVGRGGVRVWG